MIKEVLDKINNGDNGLQNITGKVCSCAEALTSSKKKYIKFVLMDKTGMINLIKWNTKDEDLLTIKEGNVLKLENCEVNRYNGTTSLVVKDNTKTEVLKIYNPDDYELTVIKNVPELKENIINSVNEIKNDNIKNMCLHLINSTTFVNMFYDHPAASKNHHAEKFGLLYHTSMMLKAGKSLADIYHANKDIVIAAILFHDIGKLKELESSESGAGNYTKYSLLGHIFLGAALVKSYYDSNIITEEEYLQIAHAVLAHHGKLEWGSPVLPATKEANIVHFVDNMDARNYCFDNDSLLLDDGELSKNVNFTLGTRVYKTEKEA